jgi:hypothetical protein
MCGGGYYYSRIGDDHAGCEVGFSSGGSGYMDARW